MTTGDTLLVGDGTSPRRTTTPCMRALLDCPVHAIIEIGERTPAMLHRRRRSTPRPAENLKTEENEAEWGFTR